jgi:hypothetical protein
MGLPIKKISNYSGLQLGVIHQRIMEPQMDTRFTEKLGLKPRPSRTALLTFGMICEKILMAMR